MSRRRVTGVITGVVGVLAAAAVGPPAAQAHPCAATWTLGSSTFLTANNAATAWAGSLPTLSGDEDCATIEQSSQFAGLAESDAAADPVQDAVGTFTYTQNMTPLGFSSRVPPVATSLADINSDMAFKGNYAFQGHWSGFRVINVADPRNPVQVYNTEACRHTSGQGDVVVRGNILVRTWDSAATGTQAGATCGGQAVGSGFEGIHIWDISNPEQPQFVRGLRMAATGNDPGAPTPGCGAHTATAVPDDARGYLYLYVGGSSGTCNGIDIVRIKVSDPNDAVYLRRVTHGRAGASCHDNNVLMNVRGGTVGYAMCAGGNGLAMYKFDMAKAADAVGTLESPGGVENPTLIWAQRMPDATTNPAVTTGHSGSFTYDGKLLIYGHEPGGGTQAMCQASSSILNKSLFFLDPETGQTNGTMVHPRPQTNRENCTWHNFNVVPTYKGYYAVVGSYQSGISVFDFSNPAAPQEIAYADPAPLSETQNITGGDWSTHFYNGLIYESDIRRGFIIWSLDHDSMRRVRQVDLSNPQTQMTSFVQDLDAPTVTITGIAEGDRYLKGSSHIVRFSCADTDSGLESCTGTVADGASVSTSAIGNQTFTVRAVDKAGNVTTKDVNYVVDRMATDQAAGGTVAATLALVMSTPAQFGAFTPGVARDYTATSNANVITTAGDAALSVSDPSSTNTGKLVNGAFTLAAPVMASAASAGGTSAAGGAVGGSAAPTSVLTYTAPKSNDTVTFTFKQAIGANEALRTGTYSKTLTFTLSTTTP